MDEEAAIEALRKWFVSQDIELDEAVPLMLSAIALILHRRFDEREALRRAEALTEMLVAAVKELKS